MPQCSHITKNGKPCLNPVRKGHTLCNKHSNKGAVSRGRTKKDIKKITLPKVNARFLGKEQEYDDELSRLAENRYSLNRETATLRTLLSLLVEESNKHRAESFEVFTNKIYNELLNILPEHIDLGEDTEGYIELSNNITKHIAVMFTDALPSIVLNNDLVTNLTKIIDNIRKLTETSHNIQEGQVFKVKIDIQILNQLQDLAMKHLTPAQQRVYAHDLRLLSSRFFPKQLNEPKETLLIAGTEVLPALTLGDIENETQ